MKKNSNRNTRTIGGLLLIMLGVGLTFIFGLRACHAFRRMPPLPPRPPHAAETDVETIRPWMNLRFISKAYGVPSDYLARYLELPAELENAPYSLEILNTELGWGKAEGGSLLIVERSKYAITEFQIHAGEAELHKVQPTMSIQFIATAARVPASYLFEQTGLPKTGNEYKSLETLSEEFEFTGGTDELVAKIERGLETYNGP